MVEFAGCGQTAWMSRMLGRKAGFGSVAMVARLAWAEGSPVWEDAMEARTGKVTQAWFGDVASLEGGDRAQVSLGVSGALWWACWCDTERRSDLEARCGRLEDVGGRCDEAGSGWMLGVIGPAGTVGGDAWLGRCGGAGCCLGGE